MQNYELLFILPGTLAENETAPLVDKVKEVVERNHGENLEIEAMDKKRLAYPIKHIRYGYFYLAFFKAESADVKKMQEDLRLVSELLRATVQKHTPGLSLKKIEFAALFENNQAANAPFETAPTVKVEETVAEEVKEVVAPVVEAEVAPFETAPTVKVEETVAEEAPAVVAPKTTKKSSKKIDLEDIDKELDKILDIDLGNV